MKSPLPLDGQPGPALPVDDATAQLLVERALEEAGPPAAAPAPSGRAAPWRWAAAAAMLALTGSATAWAAWETGALQRLLGLGARPQARTSAPVGEEDVAEVEAEPPASPVAPAPVRPGAGPRPLAAPAESGLDRGDAPAASAESPTRSQAERANRQRREPRGEARPSAARAAPAASDLLAEANLRRRMGEWGRAEALYLRAARTAAEASVRQAAWISVGELRLEQRPLEAARAFEAALRSAGPLEAEGLWGLSRAQMAAGKETEAKATLRALIERFPDRPQAARARRLLSP